MNPFSKAAVRASALLFLLAWTVGPSASSPEKSSPPKAEAGQSGERAARRPARGTPQRRAGEGSWQRQWLAAQVALDRAGFSPGEIDGRTGTNTIRALQAFQESRNLPSAGRLDEATTGALGEFFETPTVTYTVTPEDVAGPFVESLPDDMMELAKLESAGYSSPFERIAERFHVRPALLAELNESDTVAPGQTIVVPNVEPFLVPAVKKAPTPALDPATVRVRVSEETRTLRVERADGTIAFQAPVSLGSEQDPLPKGQWKIRGTAVLPVFQYNPDLFWDADPTHAKATIAAGPNNPVGVVWIDLDREHLGFHGTPEPSTVGRAQSHGCIRLTNWDAMRLASLVGRGAQVLLE